jgi:O-antigen chain-terminating methyltransferase
MERELETLPATTTVASGGVSATPAAARPSEEVSYALSGSRLQSHKYLCFEDAFRGDPELIRTRQQEYLPLFRDKADVLDIGCGRGEFLQLLKDHGITARGIDINHAMVAHCVEKGLDAREADALAYLRELPDDALGGLIAAQVVEHLQPDYLLALLREAFRVLRQGSPIALETINVASWSAFFSSYVRDVTHARPLHPETLRFFVLATGFLDAEIRFSSPLPEEEKLQSSPRGVRDVDLRTTGVEGRAILQLADAFDANAKRLNRQLYGPHDYAVVAWKR